MPEGQIIIFHILGIKAKLKVFNKQTHFTVLIILLFSILFKKKMQETMSETDFFFLGSPGFGFIILPILEVSRLASPEQIAPAVCKFKLSLCYRISVY